MNLITTSTPAQVESYKYHNLLTLLRNIESRHWFIRRFDDGYRYAIRPKDGLKMDFNPMEYYITSPIDPFFKTTTKGMELQRMVERLRKYLQ
jgi:hypothetical protein